VRLLNDGKSIESLEESEKRKKGLSSETKTFLVGTAIWSSFFILIRLFVNIGIRDWIITFSICGKIGIGFIALGLLLLGAVGTSKATGATAGKIVVNYTSESNGDSTSLKQKSGISLIEILSIGRVWLLFWGAIYLIPFAFGVPFLP